MIRYEKDRVFIGKNFQNQNSNVTTTDLTLKQMFDTISKLVFWTRWDLRVGIERMGESFMEIFVINWWRKNHQSSARDSVRLFSLCIEDPSTSGIHRSLEEKDRMDHMCSKLQRFWRNQWRADRIRGEHLSRILIRCSSAVKSKVYCTDWEKHQKISQEEFYLCRFSTTFPVV